MYQQRQSPQALRVRQKVSVATTNRGNWFVAVKLCPGNPYDGHTLAETLASTENNTGVNLTDVFVDKGYRGHDYTGDAKIHIAGQGGKRLSRSLRKRKRRRSAVEPKIGHLKSDHRMQRCFLKGLPGDAINATSLPPAQTSLNCFAGCFLRQIFRPHTSPTGHSGSCTPSQIASPSTNSPYFAPV